MEAVREAIFSSLGSVEGLKVLDLFAGSGALGMEAWSRGADSVTFVEQHARVFRNLQDNIRSLEGEGLGSTRCCRADALKWLAGVAMAYDLILAAPPYDLPDALPNTLAGIAAHSVLTPDGILVYELRSRGPIEIPATWNVLRDKKYGKTRVLVLQQNYKET